MAKVFNPDTDKVYNVSLVSYCPKQFILDILGKHIHSLNAWSICYHDMDLGKEPHFHILICSRTPNLIKTYINWFKLFDSNGQSINTLGQKCIDIYSAFRYLRHLDDTDKYQYSESAQITYNDDYFLVRQDKPDKSLLALVDLLSGSSLRDCALKYGRDFIYHYSAIKNLFVDICAQEGIDIKYLFKGENENESNR